MDRFNNRFTLFNECLIFWASLLMIPFVDVNSDPELRYNVGWVFILLSLICILVNVLLLIWEFINAINRHL